MLLKIIVLYLQQECNNNLNNSDDIDKSKINDLLSNENFTLCLLRYIIKNSFKKYYYYFFKIIFNSEYDLTDFIKEYFNNIKALLNSINLKEDSIRIEITKKLNLKNISELLPILQEYPLSYYFPSGNKEIYNINADIKYYNIYFFFADYFKDLNFLSQKKTNYIHDINCMIKENLKLLLNDWDKSFTFPKFVAEVENNILFFCKLLIIDNSLKEENCLKINFFFEFLFDIKPELKEKYSPYKEMVLTYITNMTNSEYFGFTEEQTIWNYYLMLILMYVKFKLGNYNPEILFLFLDYYEQYNKTFLLFIQCLKEKNKENMNISKHFFLGDFGHNNNNLKYLNEKLKNYKAKIKQGKSSYFLFDNIIFFFNQYLTDLNEIKFSLVYEYITSILTEYGKYNKEKECLIPSIMLNIGQNEKIINIILGKVISGEINLYDFLKVEYDDKNETKFRKFIYIFIQTAKKSNIKSKYIFPSELSNFILNSNSYYFKKENLIKNAYQLFSSLKKKSINLYICVHNNPTFIKQTFDMIDILRERYSKLKGKNSIESDDKILSFIGNEIYEFIIKFLDSKDKTKKILLKPFLSIYVLTFCLKIFSDRIMTLKDKNKINKEFEIIFELLKLYKPKDEKEENVIGFDYYLKKVLKYSIENGADNCMKFFEHILNIFNFKNDMIHSICNYIILKVLINDIKNNRVYLSFFLSFMKENNFLVNYYLKDTEFNNKTNIFNKILLQSQNKIDTISFKKNILKIIHQINNNKDMSTYLLVQLRRVNIFQKEEDLLLFILENGVNNKFLFDYLFNFLDSERKKALFYMNKVIIIKSLFLYGQNNDYYFLQKLLEFIENYLTKQEIREIIYPLKGIEEDIKASVNYLGENIDDFFTSRDKNLFIYCLTKKRKKNYEVIALLFNYCPKTFAIFELCPFLKEINNKNNLDEFYKECFDYMNHFKKEENLISTISKDFYDFSLFLKTLFETYYTLKDSEKYIFLYYIQIFILEIVPKELLYFFKLFDTDNMNKDFPNYEAWFIDQIKKSQKPKFITEKNIFIILSLYELKRLPLLPIKQYLPEFSAKIEEFVQKYKKLNIPIICLKRPFDINCLDKINDIINNKTEKLLENIYKKNPMFNLIFIIEKEKNLISNINTNNYLGKILFNLLNDTDDKLQPEKIDDENFLNALRCELGTESDNNERNLLNNTRFDTKINFFGEKYIDESGYSDNIIKNCFFTLKDFDHYASILIENCWNNVNVINYDFLGIFRNYLRILFTLSNTILSLSTKGNNNEYIPNINILNHSFFAPFTKKLKIISTKININHISHIILKYFNKKEEISLTKSNTLYPNYFFVVENFLSGRVQSV